MFSIALKHKRARLALAERQGEQAPAMDLPVPTTSGTFSAPPFVPPQELIEASLSQDLEALSAIDDLVRKNELKDTLLPKYMPFVNQYLESGARFPNPVLVRCAIWAIDTDDLETGLKLATVAIEQQQLAPASFNRDLPTFFAESITEWAERQVKAGQSGNPYIETVVQALASGAWPVVNTIVRGKAAKVAGLNAELNGELENALAFFERAQEENESAGCKTRIEQLRKKLGKS